MSKKALVEAIQNNEVRYVSAHNRHGDYHLMAYKFDEQKWSVRWVDSWLFNLGHGGATESTYMTKEQLIDEIKSKQYDRVYAIY
jgi:hypothetical protein